MKEEHQLSFFAERMMQLGVKEENNKIEVIDPAAEHPMPSRYTTQIFSEDKDGNIEILYWTLERQLISYTKMGTGKMSHVNGKPQHYKVLRLKEPRGDHKYTMPGKKHLHAEGYDSTFPWFHYLLLEAYEKGLKIKTLFITEGVFKAWMGCMVGMHVVGLSSIHHYAARDGKLHYDLVRLIDKCDVQEVVILWDGDCLDISEKHLVAREELSKRPNGFYQAIKNIRKLVRTAMYESRSSPPDVYFYHIKSSDNNDAKGLDDLLIAKNHSIHAIVDQAHNLRNSSVYFKKFDITETTAVALEYFGLKDQKRFYSMHQDKIGSKEFRFKGNWMKYDNEEDELKLISPVWAENTFWICDDFYQIIDIPAAKKEQRSRKELKKFSQATLIKRWGKNFWKYLEPFSSFCNVPSHFDYEQVIELNGHKFYNRYFPFKHIPQAGKWPHIEKLLRHIFGEEAVVHSETGKKIPRWHLGLDYIQILLLEPTEMLPVLILYSKENKTGKSTFCNLIAAIFGDNVVPIGNADLQSDFNEPYVDKLIAYCEETLLDKKKDAERIKALSTKPRILANPKGQAQFQIDFFCKFIFCSNNEKMIYVTRHDTRYWILQVPKIKEKAPNFMALMEEEIPAFIHYLKSRQLATEREDRMHFHESLLKTSTLENTVKVNEPAAAANMREDLIHMFLQDHCPEEIQMPLKEIRDYFFTPATSQKWIREILRDYLMVDQLRDKKGNLKQTRGHYPRWEHNETGALIKREISWKGRPYVFYKKDFIQD